MRAAALTLLLTCLLLGGCRAIRDAVVTSYHSATAPVHFVHRHVFSDDETPPPADASTTTSDVTTPGQSVAVSSPIFFLRWRRPPRSTPRASTTPKPHASPSS